jgi:hypothetical protein
VKTDPQRFNASGVYDARAYRQFAGKRLVQDPIGKDRCMSRSAILESPEHDLGDDWDEQDDEFGTDDEELELDEDDEGLEVEEDL